MKTYYEAFAALLDPDFDRQSSVGDFYNSPLKYLGIEGVDINADRLRKQPTLKEFTYNNNYEFINALFLNEALLRIYAPEKTILNFFFDWLSEYSKAPFFNNGNTNGSDTHKPEHITYGLLLCSSLAIIWGRYKQLDLDLPTTSLIDTNDFNPIDNTDVQQIILEIYKSRFDKMTKNTSGLEVVLNRNLLNYSKPLNLPAFKINDMFLKEMKPISEQYLGESLVVAFPEKPFNTLFHKVKKDSCVKQRTFVGESDPIRFYKKYPSYLRIWATLYLIDLHKHLREYLTKSQRPWIDGTDMLPISNNAINLFSNQTILPTSLATAVYAQMSSQNSGVRFAKSHSKPVQVEEAEKIGLLENPESESIFEGYEALFRIPVMNDDETEDRSEYISVQADSYYFNADGQANLIRTMLVDNYMEDDNVYFKVMLDQFKMAKLGLNADNVVIEAGFKGEKYVGELAIVLKKRSDKNV